MLWMSLVHCNALTKQGFVKISARAQTILRCKSQSERKGTSKPERNHGLFSSSLYLAVSIFLSLDPCSNPSCRQLRRTIMVCVSAPRAPIGEWSLSMYRVSFIVAFSDICSCWMSAAAVFGCELHIHGCVNTLFEWAEKVVLWSYYLSYVCVCVCMHETQETTTTIYILLCSLPYFFVSLYVI